MSNVEHCVHRTVRCLLPCMAGDTRLGKMRAVQRERCLLVAGNGKKRRREAVFTVAGNTVTSVGAISKLPAMDIGVTVGTLPVRDRPRHAVVLVALHALQFSMEADQREVGCTVIEIRHCHIVPAACPVTSGAIKPEFALVLVRVAGRAVLEFQIGVPAESRNRRAPFLRICLQWVTLGAVDRPMFPRQHKPCAVMVETGDRFETVVRMTLQTIGTELPSVLIDMTTQAGRIQSHECPGKILVRVDRQQIVADQVDPVALVALQGCVLAPQLEPGLHMIEILLPFRPMNQIEVATGVVVVAIETGYPVFVDDLMVISLLLIQPLLDDRMASQALVRRRALAEHVTFRAVRDSFK